MRKLVPLLAAFLFLPLLARPAPAIAKEAPAYLALGDSIAFGVGASVPEEGGYVAVVYDALRRSQRYDGRGLDLVNLAVPGATSSDLVLSGGQLDRALSEISERMEDASSSDDNVEIITVNIGGNDARALAGPDSPCLADPLSSGCQDRYLEMLDQMENNLKELLQRLREVAPKADIIVVDLYSSLSGRGGAAETIADLAVGEINALTQRVSSRPETRAKLASVYPIFRGRAAELVADDGIHPNDDGHAVIAEVVLAAIEAREPNLPDEFKTPVPEEVPAGESMGEGGLLPLAESEGGETNIPLLLAIAIPASVLGLAAIAGAYLAARGRYRR